MLIHLMLDSCCARAKCPVGRHDDDGLVPCTAKQKAVEFLQMITRTMVLKCDCIKNGQLNRIAFINAKHNANFSLLFLFSHRFQHHDLSFRLHIFFAFNPFRSSSNSIFLRFIRLLHNHFSMHSAGNVLVNNYDACIQNFNNANQYILNMFLLHFLWN